MVARQNVSVPLEADLRSWVQVQADLEGRSIAGQMRFYALQAKRGAPVNSNGKPVEGPKPAPWPPERQAPKSLSEAKDRLAKARAERDRINPPSRPRPTGEVFVQPSLADMEARLLPPQAADRLDQLYTEIDTLTREVALLEKLES
jgi:hypothetical protein